MRFTTFLLIVAGLALAGCVACHAQNNAGRALIPLNNASFVPSNLTSIAYWWVHTDVPTNDVVTQTWTPRTGASNFEQASAALRPTNTASGMYFTGGRRMTNNPLATVDISASAKGTFWMILAPEIPSAGLGVLFSDQTGDHGLYTESDNQWTYGAASGGAGNLGAWVTNQFIDIALVYTNTSINTAYTNAVAMFTRATASPYDENQRFIGGDPFGDQFKGWIREFAIFTDSLTTSNLAQLHQYATNLYGYSP